MTQDPIRTSKFLALVLRHRPEFIGLTLDSEGWAEIDALIAQANAHGHVLDRALIERVVAENDKKRYTISFDGARIRAAQGHSTLGVSITHVEREPPGVLYHGTAMRFLDSILEQGLRPGTRHHVHLSSDEATAMRVGQRHGKPVVLTIDAMSMRAEGHVFYLSENKVWLVVTVPPKFLQVSPPK